MVQYPVLDERLAECLVRLASHRILMEQSINNVPDMILGNPTLAAKQLVDQLANLENLIVQVVGYHLRKIQHKCFKEREKRGFACLVSLWQDIRLEVSHYDA